VKERWLFLCITPYAIFNALNMMETQGEKVEADIVLFDRKAGKRQYGKTLEKSGVFKNVCRLEHFPTPKQRQAYTALFWTVPKLVFRTANATDKRLSKNYTKVIAQHYYIASMVYPSYPNAEYYLIEDGLGSYANDMYLPENRGRAIKLLNKLWGNRLLPNFIGTYVYRPELVHEGFLPAFPLKSSSENTRILETVFSYKENELYKEHRNIFFGDTEMEDAGQFKYGIYEKILHKLTNREKVIYRRHPAEGEKRPFEGEIAYDTYENLWELECGKQITDYHIFVNFFSTAALSPKILYDKEPTLIFLFPLLRNEPHIHLMENYWDYVKKIKKLYRNPEKIIVIEKEEDLRSVILEQ
jgi:hypothetical protein